MEIHRLPTAGPDDVSGLARLIDDGTVSARDVIAVLGKTEGNGCVNDWSRGFSTAAYAALLATRLGTTPDAVTSRVQFIMSGGTEGIITPHVTVFVRRDVDATPRPGRGLVAGVASTRVFKPEELGTMVQIREVENSVRTAMADAASGTWRTCTSCRSSARCSRPRPSPTPRLAALAWRPRAPTAPWATRAEPPRSASRWRSAKWSAGS